jgi:spore maturation protein CgeB
VRIAVVDTYYPAFLEEHYRSHPGLSRRTYEEQLASLIERCFGTADAYSRHLRELGHEAVDIVANCPPLQARWRAEHGRPGRLRAAAARLPRLRPRLGQTPFLQSIAMAQIAALDADVVYAQDLTFFDRSNLHRLRAQGRLVVGQIASALPPKELVLGFDLVLTSFPHFPERLRAMGTDSEYLPIAFHEGVIERLHREGVQPTPPADRPHPVSFVGGLNPEVHGEGVRLLENVASRLPLEVWGYGAERLPEDSPLRRAHRGEAWGIDMYRVLAQSRIVLNRHIRFAEGYANNMRLFEATGVGALLVTEAAPNLDELFEPGREVVTYDGPSDLTDKLRHYLDHDDERLAIAAAGQARTLRDHTYAKLMRRLANLLEARRGRPS